ncbi:metallophosphoesterase [Salana multivorans]|uniref:metallophosphoesterase n=1 Tax=Salana multivorans TaxID=120377 RepID=UPI000AC2AC80
MEAHAFTVRHARVPVLPAGSAPTRVLHVSDLHLVPTQADKIAFVRDLATLEPDVVVDTGDNMAHRDALAPLVDALEPLLARPGAFVMGSNDYFAPKAKAWSRYLRRDPRTADGTALARAIDGATGRTTERLPADELARLMREAGWKDLTNRRDAIVTDGVHLDLVGVDDPHLDRDEFPARAPLPRGALRVGVAHAPYLRVLERMRDDGASLVLAGHTHGGQLALPFYGALVTNCDLDRSRAKGLHGWPGPRPDAPGGEDSIWLHVSAGLGTSPFAPLRFACRPEATLLELVAAEG